MACVRVYIYVYIYIYICEELSSIVVYVKFMSLYQVGFLLLCVDSCVYLFIKYIFVVSWCEWEFYWEFRYR